MRKVFTYLILAFMVLLLLLNIFVLIQNFVPSVYATYYMAGIKAGAICDCPVLVGDCVCKINLPK